MKIYDALGGNLEKLAQYVKQHGVDARLKSWEHAPTLLMLAVQSSKVHMNVIRFLVENGADIHERDGMGRTPLMGAARQGHLQIVNYLHGLGADITARDNQGNTPLLHATYDSNLEVLEYLIEQGADIEQKNDAGETALALVAASGFGRGIVYLVNKGADVQACDPCNMGEITRQFLQHLVSGGDPDAFSPADILDFEFS